MFVAGFIGSPAMNFFPAELTDDGVSLPFGEVMLDQEVRDAIAARRGPTRSSSVCGRNISAMRPRWMPTTASGL